MYIPAIYTAELGKQLTVQVPISFLIYRETFGREEGKCIHVSNFFSTAFRNYISVMDLLESLPPSPSSR